MPEIGVVNAPSVFVTLYTAFLYWILENEYDTLRVFLLPSPRQNALCILKRKAVVSL